MAIDTNNGLNRAAEESLSATDSGGRRPYLKPAFRSEGVFETQAQGCAKFNPAQCPSGSKHS